MMTDLQRRKNLEWNVRCAVNVGDLTRAEGHRILFPNEPPCNLNWTGHESMEALPAPGTMVYNLDAMETK